MRPLHYAAWYGHSPCIAALVAAGADVNAHDHDGATPLHAGEDGRPPGCTPTCAVASHPHALAGAFNGQLATVVALVEASADTTITDNDDLTPAQVRSAASAAVAIRAS